MHAYIRGALAIHAVRRMLSLWDDVVQVAPVAETTRLKTVTSASIAEVFPVLEESLRTHLARSLIRTYDARNQKIIPSVRKAALRPFKKTSCYLCGVTLIESSPKAGEAKLTLDHLWPQSLGGESDPENLLPACQRCQDAKADAISWEWVNVHNLIWGASRSESAKKSVSWPVRIARHYFHAVTVKGPKGGLRETFMHIGPIDQNVFGTKTGTATFFDLSTLQKTQ